MKKFFLIFYLIMILFHMSCYKDINSCYNSDCYSPDLNLEIAYDIGSVGCKCDEKNDTSICIQDKNGKDVALICENGYWQAVVDGPCMLASYNCYSPDQNLEFAYAIGFVGCKCDEKNDTSICIQDKNGKDVALICKNGYWQAVEDGPCMDK